MSGRYRDLVNVQRDGGTDDNPQPSFTTIVYRDVPCEISAVGGGEKIRGRQIEAGVDYVVEMHQLEDLTSPEYRLYVTGGPYLGRILNIVRILPTTFRGRASKVLIDCKEKVPA